MWAGVALFGVSAAFGGPAAPTIARPFSKTFNYWSLLQVLSVSAWWSKLWTAFEAQNLVKLKLTRPTKASPWRQIEAQPLKVKGQWVLSCNAQDQTQAKVFNFSLEQAKIQVQTWLGQEFEQAQFFVADQIYFARFSAQGQILRTWQETWQQAKLSQASPQHNRSKQYLISPERPFLRLLGLSNAQGQILPTQMDKYKQINKFVEILAHLFRDWDKAKPLRLMDMGCGKGYLTFALFDYLSSQAYDLEVLGVELRADLVAKTEAYAQALGFAPKLRFVAEDIRHCLDGPSFDALIALHACDTATDLALAAGLYRAASFLVVAPCCHKQLRRDWLIPEVLKPMLKHGLALERQAELLTDGLRALILEAQGYQTKVMEFVNWEHTSKNVLITARRGGGNRGAASQIAALKAQFGLPAVFLEDLLDKGLGIF